MHKDEYLNNKYVKGFITYLIRMIDGSIDLQHGYLIKDPRWKKYLRANGGAAYIKGESPSLAFLKFKDAFDQYFWPPGNFSENIENLSVIEEKLVTSMEHNDDFILMHTAMKALDWGGVFNIGSIKWLYKLASDENTLREAIDESVNLLTSDNDSQIEARFNYGKNGMLLMNSGTTKIFSFCSKDKSIIYDGRVGSALGFLVAKYLDDSDIDHLDECLNFAWGEDQAGKGKGDRRNPSQSTSFTFKKLWGANQSWKNSSTHALMNLRANWLLTEVIDQCKRDGNWLGSSAKPLRSLEATLFMIGYSINNA